MGASIDDFVISLELLMSKTQLLTAVVAAFVRPRRIVPPLRDLTSFFCVLCAGHLLDPGGVIDASL